MEYSQKFVKLHIGSDSITCTVEHPFFVNDGWIAAKDLRQGDSLFAFSGAKIRIDSVYQFKTDTAIAVYNLEAGGNHNYYVSASKVLVHNCDGVTETVTVTARNIANKKAFLKELAKSDKTPKWMKQWLKQGKNPPGYEVDHIKPLSIGGADNSSNMRLLLKKDHQIHHRYYHPWRKK